MASVMATSVTGTPRAGRGSLTEAAADLLTTSRQLKQQAAMVEINAVAGARKLGMTWDEIGEFLGLSAAAARSAHERAVRR